MNFFDYLVKYWVLIATVAAWTGALAVGDYKLETLEDAMKVQVKQNQKVHKIEVQQAEIKAKLEGIKEMQQMILDELKK